MNQNKVTLQTFIVVVFFFNFSKSFVLLEILKRATTQAARFGLVRFLNGSVRFVNSTVRFVYDTVRFLHGTLYALPKISAQLVRFIDEEGVA